MNKEVVRILKTIYSTEQIFHNTAPLEASLPVVVYSLLTSVPSSHADNKTHGQRIVYRVTIIDEKETNDSALRTAFENAGWLWEGTSIVVDNNVNHIDETYTSIDFSFLRLV